MLKLKLQENSTIDPTGKKLYLEDATSEYSAINLTGYGGINPSREQLAVFPIGVHINSKGVETKIEFEPYDPLEATVWIAKIPKDGWLSFSLVQARHLEELDLPEDVEVDSINFNISNNKLYQIKIFENSTTKYWAEIQPSSLRDTLLEYERYEQLFIANHAKLQNRLNKRYVDLLISSENLSNNRLLHTVQDAFDRVRAILQSAYYQFKLGNKFVAAQQIEFLETNDYSEI